MQNGQRGFSLMEVTVVLAIISVLMIVVYTMIEETMRATLFNESHNDLAVLTQRAVNALQTEIVQTKIVFQDDVLGNDYRAAIDLPAQHPVWPDSLLPVIQADVAIAPDTTTRFTGNALLLARQLAPITIAWDHDANSATPEIEFVADRYTFKYAYLSPTGSPSFAGSGTTLDLIMTSSIEYADYFQLSSLAAAETAQIVAKLIDAGLTRAWDPGQPVDQAFYALAGATDGTFDAPLHAPRIELARATSLLPGLRGGRISGKMHYSVAFAPAPPAPAYPLRTAMRLFAPVVPARPRFPSGLEIKIAGPAGNRQVMTRVVLMSHYATSSFESQQGFVITSARF